MKIITGLKYWKDIQFEVLLLAISEFFSSFNMRDECMEKGDNEKSFVVSFYL